MQYIPRPEDHVLGIVVDSKTDVSPYEISARIEYCIVFSIELHLLLIMEWQNFWVDIKGPQLALLPVLAFEGGTRRNVPKFEACTF